MQHRSSQQLNALSHNYVKIFAKVLHCYERSHVSGEFSAIREWLRREIHARGSLYDVDELLTKVFHGATTSLSHNKIILTCKQVTGEPLNPMYFTNYLRKKYSAIYNIEL